MGLYQRITSDGEPGSPAKIPIHIFGVALRERARGNISKAAVVNAFTLDSEDETQLDAIAAKYSAFILDKDKLDFLQQMEDAFVAAEAGFYNEATVKERLGF